MSKKGKSKAHYEAQKRKALLLLKQGHSMREVFGMLSIGQSTFYNWKKQDAQYATLVEEAQRQGKLERNKASAVVEPTEMLDGDAWKRRVLQCYVQCHGVLAEACSKAGVELAQAYDLTDEDSENYDQLFTAELKRLDNVVARMAEDELNKAVRNGDTTTARWMAERRIPHKYGRADQRLKVDHQVNFGFDDERALRVLATMFGEETVDVEFTEVAAEDTGRLLEAG